MPKNKDALIRYRVINRCLREKGRITLQELKKACEQALDIYPIGERTIAADIHAMRYDERLGYNAPIRMDKRNGVYYYDDANYSIDNIPLNNEEMESLLFTAKLLEQFRGIELFQTFTGTVQKLIDAVSVYKLSDNNSSFDFIEFERVDEVKGNEFLQLLLKSIMSKQVVRIEYKSFTSKESKFHLIHPYHLKEYRNRWYLIGYNEQHGGIRKYGLDRITGIEVDKNKPFIDKGFNAKKYFENVIGISLSEAEPVEIIIAFSDLRAQYVISQPLHHSQQRIDDIDGRVAFKYHLVPNYEFYQQILGWGDEVEVLKPEKIKGEIISLVNKLVGVYKIKIS